MLTPAAYYHLINPHRSNTFCMNAVLIYIPCTHYSTFFFLSRKITSTWIPPSQRSAYSTARTMKWYFFFDCAKSVLKSVFTFKTNQFVNKWFGYGLHVGEAIWFYFGGVWLMRATLHSRIAAKSHAHRITHRGIRYATYSIVVAM